MSDIKELLCTLAENNKETLNNIADYIHANPELGCEEVKASAYLRELLKNEGFTVEDVLKDQFPTAFKASYGNGDIHIGFLAEYDALPKIGHGCGHNLIAAMSTTAAIVCGKALKDKITVHLFGCPAEETIGSKVMMSEAGVFDGLTAALICHPGCDIQCCFDLIIFEDILDDKSYEKEKEDENESKNGLNQIFLFKSRADSGDEKAQKCGE